MAKIIITGYEVSCDPGINNISSYKGEIDVKDIEANMDLEKLITDPWWRSAIGTKFGTLTFVELRDTGAVFHYGGEDIFIKFGHAKHIDKVGLSYAYAELSVKVEE